MSKEHIPYIGELFIKMCENVVEKCLFAVGLLLSNFFIDSLLYKSMLALLFLIIFDWITGILAARKTGEKIKSAKIFRTPLKITIYFLLITITHISEYSLPEVIRYLDETMVAFLVLTELISNIENIGRMGFAVPKKLLKKLIMLRNDK